MNDGTGLQNSETLFRDVILFG